MAHQATLQFSFHLLELPPIAAMVLYSAMHFTGAIRCFTGRWYTPFCSVITLTHSTRHSFLATCHL